jgi:hypothetical protein
MIVFVFRYKSNHFLLLLLVDNNEIMVTENEVSQTVEDFPNEIGSTSCLNRDISTENSVELSAPSDTHIDADQHWEMNYHEAAIFLEVCSISYIVTVQFLHVKLFNITRLLSPGRRKQ